MFIQIAVCRNKNPSRRGRNLVFVCALLKCPLPLAFLQCFLSKEIKTFWRENSFHLGEEVKTSDFHLDFLNFLWISTSYFLLFPLLCNQRWCSQSPHQSGYSHLNLGNQKYLKMWKAKKIMLKCVKKRGKEGDTKHIFIRVILVILEYRLREMNEKLLLPEPSHYISNKSNFFIPGPIIKFWQFS